MYLSCVNESLLTLKWVTAHCANIERYHGRAASGAAEGSVGARL